MPYSAEDEEKSVLSEVPTEKGEATDLGNIEKASAVPSLFWYNDKKRSNDDVSILILLFLIK